MFHQIDPQRAGPGALGILVPHGARTLVIVRPRALEWDLLPAKWDGEREHAPRFCSFTRAEAAQLARRLLRALEAAALERVNPLQTAGDAGGTSFQIWLSADDFVWIACRRAHGQAYQPAVFASLDEACMAAERIAAVVWPAADAMQEYYFNTQNFS